MPQWADLPSGFFFELARGGLGWHLAVLDLADRDLPALFAGDVPVPPHEQHPTLVVQCDHAGAGRSADRAVFQAVPVGLLDVGYLDVEDA